MIIKNGEVFFIREKKSNGQLFREGFFHRQDLFTDADGRICDRSEADHSEVLDVRGAYVIPGLVDIHTHGCAGYDFSDADEKGLKEIAAYLCRVGVTSFCPASMTFPEYRLEKIFATADCVPDEGAYARPVGIHMEGPFLSLEKAGAQNRAYITAPDQSMFARLMKSASLPIRLVTLAPETKGAMDFIDRFHKHVHISLGHTACDYETARQAFLHGADHVTHLYNAMTGLGHREPGPAGAAADCRHVFVELICDGLHVHPAMVRAAFRLYGPDRVVLISDSMRATGLPDGETELGGQKVFKRGYRATLADNTLAGSVSDLMTCMQRAVSFGIPLADAVMAATFNPAASIGMEGEIGGFRPGARADLVIMNRQLSPVRVIC